MARACTCSSTPACKNCRTRIRRWKLRQKKRPTRISLRHLQGFGGSGYQSKADRASAAARQGFVKRQNRIRRYLLTQSWHAPVPACKIAEFGGAYAIIESEGMLSGPLRVLAAAALLLAIVLD